MEADYRNLEKEQLISIIWYLEGYIKGENELNYEFVKSKIKEVFFSGI